MGIELFLTKIVATILRETTSAALVAVFKMALEVQAFFDAVATVRDCVESESCSRRLGVLGLRVASDRLTDYSVERLLTIGRSALSVDQTKAGIYIVSDVVPSFVPPTGMETCGRILNLSLFRSRQRRITT
jgi:hypothetical protein